MQDRKPEILTWSIEADFRDALSIIILKTGLSSRQSQFSQIWGMKNPQTWFLMHPLWTIFYSNELSANWKGFSWCLISPSKQPCYTICNNKEAFESAFSETPLQIIIMVDHQEPLYQTKWIQFFQFDLLCRSCSSSLTILVVVHEALLNCSTFIFEEFLPWGQVK